MLLNCLRRLYDDECGVVISAELVLVSTLGVMSMVAGLNAVATSVNKELQGFVKSIRSTTQSYRVNPLGRAGHTQIGSSGFADKGGTEVGWNSREVVREM